MRKSTAGILLLFTLSGTSALIYQIVWIRMLSHLLGGTTAAISLVLAAFMGGLAFGSRYFGRRADLTQRPLRMYAFLEFGIAGLGALSCVAILAAPPLYVQLAHALPAPTLGVLRAVLAAVLLVPPTFLMGGTLPVLSRTVVRSRRDLGSDLGLLYAVNTLGAVLGAFLAGYVLVQTVGVLGSIGLAVLVNAAIGVAVLVVERNQTQPTQRRDGAAAAPVAAAGRNRTRGDDPDPEAAPEIGWVHLSVLFACSGFAALGYEIYWTRALQHFLGNSTYAYSAMLTTFLLGLSVGGWLGGRWATSVSAPSRLLGWVQFGIGLCAVASVFLIWLVLPSLESRDALSAASLSWPAYLMRRFLVAGGIMLVPTVLIGMTFPLINHIGIGSLARIGRGVGFLYYSNTLGAILGSLAAGFLILPWLGAKGALLITALLNAGIGIVALWSSRRRLLLDLGVAVLSTMALAMLALVARGAGDLLLADTQSPEDVVLFQREDQAAETRVYRKPTGELHMSVDGHHIGGTDPSLLRKEKILAHLPLALAPQASRSLSVGLGSGITLGTLALYEQLQQIDCVEIVPGVVDGAALFAEATNDVLADPRVDVHLGDGVQFLLTTQQRYDIISSDSKLNPEYAGNAPLLSRDYYRLCRDRLTETGVMAQWLAVQTPATEVQAIIRSFLEAFPHTALFWYDPYNIILVGSRSAIRLDVAAVQRQRRPEPIRQDLAPLQLEPPLVLAGLYVVGGEELARALGEGPINTWGHPRLEFTLIREYRRKANYLHENDNLKWMIAHRDADGLQVLGAEPEDVTRFRESGLEVLRAFATGGGISRLDAGLPHLERARQINEQDRRAEHWIDVVQQMQSYLERAEASGQLNTPDALVRAGLAHSNAGRHAQALEYFDKARELLPGDPNIQYNRLVELRELGRLDELESSLETFQSRFPQDARGRSIQGRLYAARGDFESALAAFREAQALDPSSAVIVNNVATSLARLERNGEAGEMFAQVVSLDPEFPNAAYFAAASFSRAGRTAEAAQWMRYCLEHDLVPRERFEQEGFFSNLRDSADWIP